MVHHCAMNQIMPGKGRVGFEATARSNGISLNNAFLSDPDLLKRMFSVLLLFRGVKIRFVTDIVELFHPFHRIEIADEEIPGPSVSCTVQADDIAFQNALTLSAA